MKVTQRIPLTGPNLSGPVSGLRARLDEDGDPLCGAAWSPDRARLAETVDTLVGALPELAPRRDGIAARLMAPGGPSLPLALALAEALLEDASIVAGPAAVLQRDASGATVFLPCDTGALGAFALHFGIEGTRQLADGGAGAEARMRALHLEARRRMRPLRLDQTTRALARAARARGIPAIRLAGAPHVLRLGEGAAARRIHETVSDATGRLAALLQRDKVVTQALLTAHFLPGTGARPVASAEEACMVAREIGFPVVVKPREGRKGAGVAVGLRDDDAVRAALARPDMLPALVERHVAGRDYRLLVAGGRLVAAAERRPAEVVGTGRHSVAELVEAANRDPRRGLPFERQRERLSLDAEALRRLAAQGLAPDSVPAPEQRVRLSGPANVSTGGTARDVTDAVAPQTARQAVRAARLVGLDIAGIDVVAPDIARPLDETGGAILEVNVSPGLRAHADAGRDVAAAVIGALFPRGAAGRIPTVGITGSLGKSTTCRMLARILQQTGRCVALTTTKGAYIGQERLSAEDCAGGGVAESLLDDPSVEIGVFELARGNLIRRGMVLDSLSVGALLNVRDNHVGFDGVETREQMAAVKSIVPRAARDVAVLNADDPLCLSVRPRLVAPRLCLVSPSGAAPDLAAHRDAGGAAAWMEGEGAERRIVLWDGAARRPVIAAADIPATLGGRFDPPAENALFAAAIAMTLGVGPEVIADALRGFHSDIESNPGRMNRIEGLACETYLTSVDGVDPARALARWARRVDVPGTRRIVTSNAGDRTDAYLRDSVVALAEGFDRVHLFEWDDRRGRAPGEINAIHRDALTAAGLAPEAVTAHPDLATAIAAALAESRPGDLLVVEPKDYQAAWSLLTAAARES